MKFVGKVLSIFIALILTCMTVTACGPQEKEYDFLAAGGLLLCDGECVVTLVITDEYAGFDEEIVLSDIKQSISADDIILQGAISGKNIVEVQWVGPREINLVLDGSISKPQEGEFSYIKLKGSAMENGKMYRAVLTHEQFFVPFVLAVLITNPADTTTEVTFGLSALYCEFLDVDPSMFVFDVPSANLVITKNNPHSLTVTMSTDGSAWHDRSATLTLSASATTANRTMAIQIV